MVILETAAIGAAGYGLYKGGEAGVKKGKECHREMQREKKRSSQRSSLREKINTRNSRIAEIVRMKENGGAGPLSRFGFGANNGGNNNAATAAGATTTTLPGTYSERQLARQKENADINDRHRNVMEKLRTSRQEERKTKKSISFNPFKKK